MATYTIDNRPKRLRPGDSVVFVVNGEECGYQVPEEGDWLRDDRDVFEALGMGRSEKASMTERCFGYVSTNLAFWPTAKPRDFAAHCRLVNALYDLIEERDGKKHEICQDKATNGPWVFLGYDWTTEEGGPNLETELSQGERYKSPEEVIEDLGVDDKPVYIFKLYAVDVKKYSYKLVQED